MTEEQWQAAGRILAEAWARQSGPRHPDALMRALHVLRGRFDKVPPDTFAKLGGDLGVSGSRVQQINEDALIMLRRECSRSTMTCVPEGSPLYRGLFPWERWKR